MRGPAVIGSAGFLIGSLWGAGVSHKVWEKRSLPDSEEKQKVKAQEAILKYGPPGRAPEISYYDYHLLSYDQEKKIPKWVAEDLTRNQLTGNANRKHSKFRSDPSIRELFRSENSDFSKSGWSRGHMAPAGDFKCEQKAMNDTFLLSNILPQDFQNNGGFWNRFEIYCRNLTKSYEHVRVISGPVMAPTLEENGKQFVKYQVIGQNQVAVPTHLYKVIVAESEGMDSPLLGSFIVPNIPIDYSHKLVEYQVELEEVEKRTGLAFLPKLDRTKAANLCTADGCKLMGRNEFELYFISRRLAHAGTLARLEKTWAEIETKNLTPDDYVKELYAKRKKEFMDDTDSFKRH